MHRNRLMQAAVLLMLVGSGCSRKQAAAPAPPPPPPPKVPAPPAQKSTASKPVSAPAKPPESAKPPSLGEILPSPSREQILKDIEGSLDRAQRNIATLQALTTTTPERTRDIARVQTFIRQAQDARSNNDLVVARSLAERADLLSQDLVRAP